VSGKYGKRYTAGLKFQVMLEVLKVRRPLARLRVLTVCIPLQSRTGRKSSWRRGRKFSRVDYNLNLKYILFRSEIPFILSVNQY